MYAFASSFSRRVGPVKTPLAQHVRRVEVTDPIATGRRYDYADAFEVRLPGPDGEAPETWVLAGLADSPAVMEWIASLLLGHGRAPSTSSDRVVDGWRVMESTPEVVHLEQPLPLMHVVVVGRRVGSSGRMLTSVLHFERPVLARLVWAVVGMGHRRMVRRLLGNTSSATTDSETRGAERAS
jgi:hypothetical protein